MPTAVPEARVGSLAFGTELKHFARTARLGVPAALALVLIASTQVNYLLFHTLAELFSIVVAVSAFVVAWNAQPFSRNHFLVYLGIGLLWVAGLDLVHTLLYRGMNIYAVNGANAATQFWIGTRYVQAALLLSAPLFLKRSVDRVTALAAFGTLAGVLYLLIMSGNFPDAYVESRGLTPFKVCSEYAIIALLALALVHLWRRRDLIDPRVAMLVAASVVFTMVAELAFTFYVDVYALSNLVGHIAKLFAYWLIYLAIVEFTLAQPFRTLSRGASTYDAIPDPVCVVDRDGIVHQLNRAAARATGLAPREALGADCHRLFHAPEVPAAECPVCRKIFRGEAAEDLAVELTVTRRTLEITVSPIALEGEALGMVHVVHDVTRRARAEAETRRLNQDLEHRVEERTAELKQANQEMEAFSYSISHDLQAPLRAIEGFSRAVIEDYADRLDAQARDYLERVQAGTGRMGAMIQGLLALSRAGRADIRMVQVDLSATARSVAARLEEAEPDRSVEFVIAEEALAQGDPVLLERLLENLLGNAWKFTGKQSSGRIEFGRTEEQGKPVFYVRDNGVGFDPAHADRLFVPFQRLHGAAEFPGTGIGLALVSRIVRRHGGRVWADALPGGGATFYFTLGGSQ